MICKFCSGVHDIDIEEHVAVDLYSYKGELVACCFNCLSNLDIKERQPINLPNGWKVIKKDKRDEMETSEKAFITARKRMIEYSSDKNVPGGAGHRYDLRSFFDRIIDSLEIQIRNYKQFNRSIGLYDQYSIDASGAHCPQCQSPLLKVAQLPSRHALTIAASKIATMMESTREGRNPNAFVCLCCQVAYIESPTKKGKKQS